MAEDNPVRVVEVFVDELDLGDLGFDGMNPAATGRPAYHPSVLLKIYIYGYLNRIQSSRLLEREAQRNVELMWLTQRLRPDFKTIADFRRDNGRAIRNACRQFVVLCGKLDLFSQSIVAIDGSKFKAVYNRDHNFTDAKIKRRLEQIEQSIERYLAAMDTADRAQSGAASEDEPATLSALPSRHLLNLGLQWLDRVDGLDDMAHRLLLCLGEVRVPAVHQQDQAWLVRTVPGLVCIGPRYLPRRFIAMFGSAQISLVDSFKLDLQAG